MTRIFYVVVCLFFFTFSAQAEDFDLPLGLEFGMDRAAFHQLTSQRGLELETLDDADTWHYRVYSPDNTIRFVVLGNSASGLTRISANGSDVEVQKSFGPEADDKGLLVAYKSSQASGAPLVSGSTYSETIRGLMDTIDLVCRNESNYIQAVTHNGTFLELAFASSQPMDANSERVLFTATFYQAKPGQIKAMRGPYGCKEQFGGID